MKNLLLIIRRLKIFLLTSIPFCIISCHSGNTSGTCNIYPTNDSCVCHWTRMELDNKVIKVTTILDTVVNQVVSIDSLITGYKEEEDISKKRYTTYLSLEDSIYEERIYKKHTFRLIKKVERKFKKRDGTWYLNIQNEYSFNTETQSEVSTTCRYENNMMIDSSVTYSTQDKEVVQSFFIDSAGQLWPKSYQTWIREPDSSFRKKISKNWVLKEEYPDNSIWKIKDENIFHSYIENRNEKDQSFRIYVMFYPNNSPSIWLEERIIDTYKPILEDLKKGLHKNINDNIDYTCVLDTEGNKCYENYYIGRKLVKKAGSINDYICPKSKTFAYIQIDILNRDIQK